MTVNDALEVVVPLSREQRVLWLIDLGWAMTVSARGGYPLAGQAEPISPANVSEYSGERCLK